MQEQYPQNYRTSMDVPSQIIDAFLTALPSEGITADVADRLRKVLLEEKNVAAAPIKSALFPTDDKL